MQAVMYSQINQELTFDPQEYPNTYQYVRQLLVRNRRCKKCGSPVLKSQYPDTEYQCMVCDEDIKKNRTIETIACTEKDLNQVYFRTRDLMHLDDHSYWGKHSPSFDVDLVPYVPFIVGHQEL